MRTFAVSALREPPFPAGRHDSTDLVARQSIEWARDFGLIDSGQRLRRADVAGLAGRACPDGPVERLRLLSDLVAWLFVVDDACDEDGLGEAPTRLAPTVAALLDVLDRHGDPAAPLPTAAGPLGDALDDLCRRVRAAGAPAMLLRFAAQVRDYLLALLWEAANRERERVPGLAEYVQMRRHTGAVGPSLTLTELALGGHPAADRRTEPALVALDLLAMDLVCWCNDVFSYGKERRSAPDGHNLVTVIARETGGDEEAALRAAADRFNDALAAYLAAEATLRCQGDAELHPALVARRNWIRATYDWSLVAARYA
ncbi:terpene synthase [Micromonospora sp. C28SCA-DRY-2]|uniref:terpene synthase family protein n=1 Tax=Micromonospora sp. C28SCA-DRY-2 TaxID=3059522 RepID=UPI00267754B8|nr:terpene synthase [Micromonospora sp. C28SCA-DRY-2]MDO3704682.1 terpene synthase [Micromonospora sp. C28SCA-DRY-2]